MSGYKRNRKIDNKKPDQPQEIQTDPDQLHLGLDIPQTFRTEYNFVKFPFFDLAKNSKREEIKIEETKRTDKGQMKMLWWVTRDIKHDFPGDFEKRLHRAIEQIINTMPKPIENPLRIGSLRYLARLMGINPDSGKNRQDIQKALENLVTASIKAEGSFRLKEDGSIKVLKDTFHLYDRVVYTGEKLPNGNGLADCVYVLLGSWYLTNINSNYVMPLDWNFYNKLQGPLTTRMYEFLSVYFFVALQKKFDFYDIRYSRICHYFPLVRYKTYGEARRQLKKAHEALSHERYLAKIEWLDTAQVDDWAIRYYIGPRARQEYERNKPEIRRITDTQPITIPQRRRLTQAAKQTPENRAATQQLVARGISHKVAQRLTQTRSVEYLQHKIAVFDWLLQTHSPLLSQNRPGFLRKSIEENYEDPDGYTSLRERQKQVQHEAKKRDQHDQRLIDDYCAWYNKTPAQRGLSRLETWQQVYLSLNKHRPPPEEVEAKRRQILTELLSPKQQQIKFFGSVRFPEMV